MPFNEENIVRTVVLKGFEDDAWRSWTEKQLDDCIRFIREWLKSREMRPPDDLQKRLGAVRIKTANGALERADSCYFPEKELKLIYPEANFAKLDEGDEEQRDFLSTLGVTDRPRIFEDEKKFNRDKNPDFTVMDNWKTYWKWLCPHRSRECSTYDGSLTSVTAIDKWDSIDKSHGNMSIVLSLMVKNWPYYKEKVNSDYHCGHKTHRSKPVPSFFKWQLLETGWLPTNKGIMKPLENIFIPLAKIKRVAGALVPYISIPEGWKEQEFLNSGQDFFKFLGLCTEFDIDALKHLLEVIQKHPIDDNLKQYLSRIYRELGKLLEEESESELDRLKLLSEVGTFEDSTALYWNDDRDLGGYFHETEGVSFAWTPQDVERGIMETLFKKAGVKALSKAVQRELIMPVCVESNESWTHSLHEKARYIYSLLKHYRAEKADMAGAKLNEVDIKSSDKLEVLLRLNGVESAANVKAFYDAENNVFYRIQDTDSFEMAMELARVFSLDFGHITDIEVILNEKDSKKVEERFQRQGIALLELERELLPVSSGIKETGEKLGETKEKESADRTKTSGTIGGISTIGSPSSGSGRGVTPHTTYIAKGRSVLRARLPYDERMKEEALNIGRIIKFEERQGRSAKDVSREYCGFDLESTDKKTGEIRYIESKGPGYVMLTPNEYNIAKEVTVNYFL